MPKLLVGKVVFDQGSTFQHTLLIEIIAKFLLWVKSSDVWSFFHTSAHLTPVFSCWVKVMESKLIQVTRLFVFFVFFFVIALLLHKWFIVTKNEIVTE